MAVQSKVTIFGEFHRVRGVIRQPEGGDRSFPQLSGDRMLEAVGIGFQLAGIEGDVSLLGFGGLEIDHAEIAVLEFQERIEFPGEIHLQVMPGDADGLRNDELLRKEEPSGRQVGRELLDRAVAVMIFHRPVDTAENGREG